MTRAKYLRSDDGREPEEISALLGEMVEHARGAVDIRHGELVDAWDDVVPSDWRLGHPIGIRDGVLLVTVPDGATASLLRYQVDPLLEAVRRRFGAIGVASVRVRVERPGAPGSSRD